MKVVYILKQSTSRMRAGGREVVWITVPYKSDAIITMEKEGRGKRYKGQQGKLTETTKTINISDKLPSLVSWDA